MFEKLLEKVLESYFGRFVSGLDRNNLKLGVWSGNVAIENVTLRPEVIELLELPIKLKYSKIGKMHFKIPWQKLSSQPIEIMIDSLYITVAPLDPNQWNFSDQVIIEKKFQLLLDYCRDCMSRTLKKKKKQTDSKDAKENDLSYLDKMTTKIIDNIQLKISNIHLRWEQEDPSVEPGRNIYKQSQSWGITLQSLLIESTDEKWQKQFIDRSETKFSAMNRLFELNNLAIYWNQFEKNFVQSQDTYVQYMDSRIYKDDGQEANKYSDFVVTIRSDVRVTQNPIKSEFLPLYQCEITLQWLDIKLEKNQFKQLLSLLEGFSVYTNLLWVQRRKAQELSESTIKEYQTGFHDLFSKVYMSEQKQLDVLQDPDAEKLRIILRSVGYENLLSWTKYVAKALLKENKVNELTLKKQKKENSWWKNLKSKDKDKNTQQQQQQEEVTEEEINEIESQIEQIFEDEGDQISDFIRSKDSVEKRIEFSFQGGTIQITSAPQADKRVQAEGLELKYFDMQCIVEQLNDGSLDVIFKLKNLETYLLTQYVGQEIIRTPFLLKSDKDKNLRDDQFFKLTFQKHVEVILQGSPQISATLGLQIQPVKCIYNPIFISRFFDFFETQNVNEALRNATRDKLEAIQDSTQNKVDNILNSAIKLTLMIDVSSPILILPFSMNNDVKCECWIINLGNLKVHTQQHEDTNYDCYKLELLDTQFQYYPSLEYYYNQLASEQPDFAMVYDVVKSDTLTFSLYRLKRSLQGLKNVPMLKLEGDLPPLNLNVTVYLHEHLLNIKKLFVPKTSENEQIEILQNEKKSIMANCAYQGELKRKDRSKNIWQTYHVVCSGAYLYLFKELKDLYPETYIYIKRADVSKEAEAMFSLTSRHEKTFFNCLNEEERDDWVKNLQAQITSFSAQINPQDIESSISTINTHSDINLDEVTQDTLDEASLTNVTLALINLKMQQIKISLQREKQKGDIYCLEMSSITYMCSIASDKVNQRLAIGQFNMVDYIFEYQNPTYQPFIVSNDDNFLVYIIDQDKIDNQNWITNSSMDLGDFSMNWKPDVILELRKLFVKNKSLYELQDDEANFKLSGKSDAEIKQLQIDNEIQGYRPQENQNYSLIEFDKIITLEKLKENLTQALDVFVRDGKKLSIDQFESGFQIIQNHRTSIKLINMNLLHHQTHTSLGSIRMQNFERMYQVTQLGSFTSGVIGDVQLSDVTAYPNTVDSNLNEVDSKMNCILYGSEDNQKGNLVTFNQAFFERKNLNQQVTSFLKIDVQSSILKYQHQPAMRFINYITTQLIGLFTQPESLTMNENFGSPAKQQPKLVPGTVHQIFQYLVDPTFLAIRLTVEKPIVKMARNYEDIYAVELIAEKLTFSNHHSKEVSRMVKNHPKIDLPVWVDNQFIRVDEAYFKMGGKKVSNIATYEMEWVRLLHVNEFKELFPQVQVKSHFNLKSYMTPLNLELLRSDYLYFNSVFFHNLTFDDRMDNLFIHDYQVYQNFAPTEIRYMIYLPTLTLNMKSDFDQLISSMELQQVQIEYVLKQSTDKGIKFYAQHIEFCEYLRANGKIFQNIIIGELGQKAVFTSQREISDKTLNDNKNLYMIEELRNTNNKRNFKTVFEKNIERKQSLEAQKDFHSKQFLIDVIIDAQSPTKEIIISFNSVRLSANTRKVFQLIDWISITQECYPPYKSDDAPKGLAVVIYINNSIMVFPNTKDNQQLLTARGDITYIFQKQPFKNCKVQNSHQITLNNIELFIQGLTQRQIMLPVLIFFGIQEEFDRAYLLRKIDCTFQRTQIKASHDDLQIIFTTIQYQFDQLSEEIIDEIAPSPELGGSGKFDYYMLNSSFVPDVYQTLTTVQCVLDAVQIVIVSGSLVPVPYFDLYLNESQIQNTSKKHQYLFNIQTQIQASHYNNSIGVWEPFIEPFLFQVDYSTNDSGNPKQYLTVIINPEKFSHLPLNINLSGPILRKLKRLISVWDDAFSDIKDKMVDQSELLGGSQLIQSQILQAISPYIILNKTGHQLLVRAFTKIFSSEGSQINEPQKEIIKINNSEQEPIKYNYRQDILFQQSFSNSDQYAVERRKLIIGFDCQYASLSQLQTIDFDRVYYKKEIVDFKFNNQTSKVGVIVNLQLVNNHKLLTISSDLQLINKCSKPIQFKIMWPTPSKIYLTQNIQADEIFNMPIGLDNSLLCFRYWAEEQGPEDVWSSYIDVRKTKEQKRNTQYDLCPQHKTGLILTYYAAEGQRLHSSMVLQCPYVIRNLLPSKVSFKITGVKQDMLCNPFEELKISQVQLNMGLEICLKLPGFQLSQPVKLETVTKRIIVRDYLGIELGIKFYYIGPESGFYTYLLEVDKQMIIRNQVGIPLYYYGRFFTQKEKENKGTSQIQMGPLHQDMRYLPGQPLPGITEIEDNQYRNGGNLQACSQFDIMQIALQPGGSHEIDKDQYKRQNFSMQFPVKEGLGRYLVRAPLANKGGFIELVAQTTNFIVDEKLQNSSPMLTIHPKCLVVNNFDQDLLLYQQGVQDQFIIIKKGTRTPFYFFAEFARHFYFVYELNGEKCKTGNIGLEITGTLTCPVRNLKDKKIMDYVLISSIEEEKLQYLKIESKRPNTKPLYLIKNRLQNLKLQLFQSCSEEITLSLKTVVKPQEDQNYAFDHPTHPKEITLEIIDEKNQYLGNVNVSLQHAEQVLYQELRIPNSRPIGYYIHSYFSIQNRQIIVRFSHEKPKSAKVDEIGLQDQLISQMDISVPFLNISFISTPDREHPRRREIVVTSISGIEYLQIRDEHLQTIQFVVRKLQIDSNRLATCAFPVLLTSTNIDDPKKQNPPMISCIIKRAPQIDFAYYFKLIQICVQPCILKVTEGTLEDLYIFYLQANQDQDDDQTIQSSQLSENQREILTQKLKWESTELTSVHLCFIERLEIYPLHFILSFQMQEAEGKALKRYIQAPPGKSLLNIDEARIKLKGYCSENVEQTLWQFFQRLKANYQDDMASNYAKLILSLNILGDPMGLFRNVGEGFQDLWEMPKEGFLKGPLEGGIGIAKGVGSLTKGVFSGTFNTVQKITGTIAQGFSELSMDDKYQQERQQKGLQKPKHVLEGVSQGMISLFSGIGNGIAGIVVQPAEGAKNQGVEGFFKGIGKGITGLVVKPVVGVMDLTSKTAEGIKNTTNIFDDRKLDKRFRLPRVFYGSEQYYKNFKLQDAEIITLLSRWPQLPFQDSIDLLELVPYVIKNRVFAYILTINLFVMVDVTEKKLKFDVPTKSIGAVLPVSENELQIQLNQSLKSSCDPSKTAGLSYEPQKIRIRVEDKAFIIQLKKGLQHLKEVRADQ